MKRKDTRKSNWGKITDSGCGGFLNPPTHPEHTQSVTSVYGHTFYISLTGAVAADWLDDECRTAARKILDAWEPLPLESPEVQGWISQVMGYFKGCYQGPTGSWNASDLYIGRCDLFAMENQDRHAGVHLIRKYYPEFVLTEEILKNARWGK